MKQKFIDKKFINKQYSSFVPRHSSKLEEFTIFTFLQLKLAKNPRISNLLVF